MPANLTTLVHFSASAATKAPNSAALRIIGMVPTSLSRALMSAVASPALISRLSRLMISTGVPAGAQTPAQVLASYPGSVSAMVGTSGSMSNRWLPATARARRSLSIAAKALSNSSLLLILIGLIAVPVASPPSWICSRKGLEKGSVALARARRRQHVTDQLDALAGQFGGYARDAGDVS